MATADEVVIVFHATFSHDGRPVVGAEIGVQEIRRLFFNLFGLGRPHAEYVGRTDERGYHRMTIDMPRREVHIELSPVECEHDGDAVVLTKDKLHAQAETVVEFSVLEARCEAGVE